MKRSAYIGLAALLVLMLGLSFGVSSFFNNKEEPPDLTSEQANANSGTGNTGGGDQTVSRTGPPDFAPDRPAAPATNPETLQQNVAQPVVNMPQQDAQANPVPPAGPSAAQGTQYKIVQGDNYYKIAEKYYGARKTRYVRLIEKANPDKNPVKLKIGDTLVIPPKPADEQDKSAAPQARRDTQTTPAPAANVTAGTSTVSNTRTGAAPPALNSNVTGQTKPDRSSYKTYVVKKREGFRVIARRQLGKESRWKELYELNKGLGLVKNENGLKAGQKIVLPKKNA